MSKLKIYQCDICGKQVENYEFNRFKKTYFAGYNIGWQTKRFDICNTCLYRIKREVKEGVQNE